MEARTPPHSLEAEKSVLGSMLISRDAAELSAEMLTVQDFYMPQHQYIFEAMCDLVNHAKAVDSVTIVDALERAGKLAAAGGIGYIAELSLFVPSAANVSYYIKIVEDRSVLRQLIAAGGEIIKTASDSDAPITDILDEAERRVFNISMKKNEDTMVPVDKSALEAYMRIGELMKTKGEISGVPTGFKELDELTSGLQKGDLIIVAARPSVGKSTFAMNIAEYAATAANKKVAVFSLEMSHEQLTTRMLCSLAKVDMQKVNTGETTEEDLLVLSDALLTLSDSKMYIDDSGNLSVADIRSRCRRQQTRYGLDLVVIDYLGLLQLGNKRGSLVADIAEATRALKILAKELQGLKIGAEDYIVKPFSVLELLVRIEKVLDRAGKLNKVLRCRDITIDTEKRTVTKSGEAVALQPLEFDLLVKLIKFKNCTMSRERLLSEIWGVDFVGGTRTVDTHVASLRKKLGLEGVIVTVTRIGYRLED